jgi:DNA-binding transcriptional ArsR family regulator
MTIDAASSQPPTEIFKALADPVRWDIVMQMASVDELACMTLEDTLPVSKPTISYHTKILYHAGLITVRKSGRNYFYSLRRDVLRNLLFDLWVLAPTSQAAEPDEDVRVAMGRLRQRSTGYALAEPARKARATRASTARKGEEKAAPSAVS